MNFITKVLKFDQSCNQKTRFRSQNKKTPQITHYIPIILNDSLRTFYVEINTIIFFPTTYFTLLGSIYQWFSGRDSSFS